MKNILLVVTLLFAAIATSAQTDTITIKKKGKPGAMYTRAGEGMTMKDLDKALKEDAVAYSQFKSGKSAKGLASVFSFAGGFLIGWEVGRAVGSETSIKPAMIIAGAISIGMGIPFAVSGNMQTKAAVRTYNSNMQKRSAWYHNVEGRICFTGNGFGLGITF